jgi:hypothetical protein
MVLQPGDYLGRAQAEAACDPPRIDDAIRSLDEGARTLGGAITLRLAALDLEIAGRRWDAALARIAAIEADAQRKETWIVRRADLLRTAGRSEEAAAAYRAAAAAIEALPAAMRSREASSELSRHVDESLAELREAGIRPTEISLSRSTP